MCTKTRSLLTIPLFTKRDFLEFLVSSQSTKKREFSSTIQKYNNCICKDNADSREKSEAVQNREMLITAKIASRLHQGSWIQKNSPI